MKKDLRSRKSNEDKTKKSGLHGVRDQAFDNLTPQQALLLKSLQGKSQQELQEDFLHTAKQQIQQGTYNERAILQMIEHLGPLITNEQKDKMQQMLRSLHGNG